MTAGFLDVNGARLRYEEAGSGPALVMLHGHLIDSGQWDSQVAAFAPEFRVVRYDARGFGRSDKPAESFAFFEDLRVLLRLLEIERGCLVGCSGGGATIIDLALAHPEMSVPWCWSTAACSATRSPNSHRPSSSSCERRGSAATWTAPSSSPCRSGPTGSAGVRSRSTPRPGSARGR